MVRSGDRKEEACRGDLVARERRQQLSAAESRALGAHLDDCAWCRTAHQIFIDLAEDTGVERYDGARIERMAARARRWTRDSPRASHGRGPTGAGARARVGKRRIGIGFGPRLRLHLRSWALAASVVLIGGTASATAWWWRSSRVADADGDAPSQRPSMRHGRIDRAGARLAARDSAVNSAELAPSEAPTEPVTEPDPEQPAPSEAPASPLVVGPAVLVSPRGRVRGRQPARFGHQHGARWARDVSASSPTLVLRQASEARRAGNIDRALALYRTLREQFPTSSEAVFSAVPLGGLLLERKLPRAALSEFDGYLTASHGGVLIPEALYGRGRALRALGDRGEERRTWERMLSDFPNGTYGPFARRRLAELK
jgi:hypothetical protein